MTLILGLPQAIHLYKCKKTGNVKYYSYWMFLFGILSWIFLGAFDPVQKMFAIVISNCICSLIYVITLWLTYRYSSDPKRKRNQWIVLFSSLLLSIFVIRLVNFSLSFRMKTTPNCTNEYCSNSANNYNICILSSGFEGNWF